MSRQASGLRAWLWQRLSAIVLLLYSLYLIGLFLFNPPTDHAAWRAWVSDPLHSTGLLLCLLALLVHAWVGLRDVLLDYVPIFALRLTLLSLSALGLTLCGLWGLRILLTPLLQ
jgi:succinate dehydrogenase / fumarate reductase membrane anchor subunit